MAAVDGSLLVLTTAASDQPWEAVKLASAPYHSWRLTKEFVSGQSSDAVVFVSVLCHFAILAKFFVSGQSLETLMKFASVPENSAKLAQSSYETVGSLVFARWH